MARLLDAMKQVESLHRPSRAASPADVPAPVPPVAAEERDAGAIMSFIEVGPRHSIEASADVLAVRPLAAPATTAATLSSGVSFRPVAHALASPASFAHEIVAYHSPQSPLSQQYGELLSSVLDAAGKAPTPAFLLTAACIECGATTVVLNLAVTAARQGRPVLVVDANPRRPAIAARLGLCDRPGLMQVLMESATLGEAIQETAQPGLAALVSGGRLAAPPPFVAATLRSLVRQLRTRFDLILFDGPKWDGRPEMAALAAAVDATFLVQPTAAPADDLVRQLAEQAIRIAGCILAIR